MRLRPLQITPASTWEAVRRDIDAWAREVRSILNGGVRLRDQTRVVRDVVIDPDALPVVIEVPKDIVPIGVELVRATARPSDGTVISGGSVVWRPVEGGIRIEHLDALGTGRFDCTFVVVE